MNLIKEYREWRCIRQGTLTFATNLRTNDTDSHNASVALFGGGDNQLFRRSPIECEHKTESTMNHRTANVFRLMPISSNSNQSTVAIWRKPHKESRATKKTKIHGFWMASLSPQTMLFRRRISNHWRLWPMSCAVIEMEKHYVRESALSFAQYLFLLNFDCVNTQTERPDIRRHSKCYRIHIY